jgi:hypothetical protein
MPQTHRTRGRLPTRRTKLNNHKRSHSVDYPDLANALLTTALDMWRQSRPPTGANASYGPVSWPPVDSPGPAKSAENRKSLAPENAGGVGFDLVQRLVDRAGVEVVIAVPSTVAVGQYKLQLQVSAL